MAKNRVPDTYGELSHGDEFFDEGKKYKVSGKVVIKNGTAFIYTIDKYGDSAEFEIRHDRAIPKTRKESLQ